ncbi:uncharacterized protein K444DRAFT_664051 [Hyaloscypha bicolor E]|uniref:Ubiquitin-like domain-containing protein n=1 Tax=Hyaloscypha bicolor E TaxID=1095630 RepID=A0A2J6T7A0_9HELO|nr:uncharacterized protein K444DRAFT_664051 [Hyaloscypha bicolor E]PMD58823.1 hypothetical protein K444DRAFT_664051 [Hyaloscypha bicolor E]
MSNIIQQMDPRPNPQVVTNDYDLVDPNGNVILPLLWDAVVQDGMIITLRPKQPVVVPPVEVQQLQADVQQLQPQVQALQQLRPQVQALQQLQPQVQVLQQGMERMERRVRNVNQKRISILRWFTT